jgi:hypothetical protein
MSELLKKGSLERDLASQLQQRFATGGMGFDRVQAVLQ